MIHRHHRKRRSQGGDDSPVNVIEIPDELHERIHREPEWAYENGLLVKSHQDPAEVTITIPEEVVKKPRVKRAKVEPKQRVTTQIRTPKDEVNVIPELIEANREKHAATMGWEDDVPDYFVIVLALVKLLELEPGDEQEEPDGDL